MTKRVLLTGVGGFIGAHCVKYFLDNTDWFVIGLDSFRHKGTYSRLSEIEHIDPSRFQLLRHDLSVPIDIQLENRIMSRRIGDRGQIIENKLNYIVNMASDSAVERSVSDPGWCWRNNCELIYNMLELARRVKPEVFFQVSCYDEETRVMTKHGFKRYDQINVGDKILSLNSTTKILEEKEIEEIIVQDYTGEMYNFDFSRVNLKVTPNHRMFYQDKNGNVCVDSAENLSKKSYSYKFPKASWKGKKEHSVLVPGFGQVLTEDLFYLCGLYIGDGFFNIQTKKVKNKTGLKRSDFLKLSRDEKGRFKQTGKIGTENFSECHSYRIWIDIPFDDPAFLKCCNVLDKIGINYTTPKNKSGEHIYFSSECWVNWFRQFGIGAKNKHIPNWMLQYDAVYLEKLLEGLIDSDGHTDSTNTYSTCSENLVKDVCELSLKLGYFPHFKKRHYESFFEREQRIIKGVGYTVYICKTHPRFSKKYMSIENYSGKIWCLKVKDNKNLIVERNGKIAICGNTDEVYGDCPDNYSHPEWDVIVPSNPYCLLPETRIFTSNGCIEIRDLDILKDKVVSKSSASSISFQKAHKKFKYNYCGNVRSIRTVVGEIVATDEHKFFRMETHFSSGNGLKNIYGQPISLRPHRKIVEQPAKNLRKGDKVLCARFMPFPKETISHNVDFCRFLGYFLGDGSFSTKSRYVRLADQKLEYIEYYQFILEELLGVSKKSSTGNFGNVYKHTTKDCWYLQFASENLRDMVDLSSKKKIVESSLNFDRDSVLSFVGGFLDAESHFRVVDKILRSITCFQKHKYVLEIIQLLLHRIGVVSSIGEARKGYVLKISDSYSLRMVCDNVPTKKKEMEFEFPKAQHKNWNKKFYWCRILKIEDRTYEGEVYDLEVLKHSNFIAEYFIVHNSASKAAQEALAISYWRTFDVPLVLSNCMNCIGTWQDKEKFLPKLIWKIATNQQMEVYSDTLPDGSQKIGSRFYLHCDNHADVFKYLANRPIAMYNKGDQLPDRYNVVGEVELDNLEMAKLVAEIMGKDLKYKLVPSESARRGYDRRYALDGSKLRNMGWKPPVEFRKGLEEIVNWTLAHPWWVV